jgi:aspartyl-tRNA(Asn)/glutamyl-tRNA(Gln) amidotransferase subunit C
MELSKEQTEQIAKLARLELTDEELKTYGGQLSAVLGYIDQLKEVDTNDIEPTAQVTGLTNIFREDEIKVWDEAESQAALDEAPALEKGQIKVKRVLE